MTRCRGLTSDGSPAGAQPGEWGVLCFSGHRTPMRSITCLAQGPRVSPTFNVPLPPFHFPFLYCLSADPQPPQRHICFWGDFLSLSLLQGGHFHQPGPAGRPPNTPSLRPSVLAQEDASPAPAGSWGPALPPDTRSIRGAGSTPPGPPPTSGSREGDRGASTSGRPGDRCGQRQGFVAFAGAGCAAPLGPGRGGCTGPGLGGRVSEPRRGLLWPSRASRSPFGQTPHGQARFPCLPR